MSLRIIITACLCGIAFAKNPFDSDGNGIITRDEFNEGVDNWLLGKLDKAAIDALFVHIDKIDGLEDDQTKLDTDREVATLGNWMLRSRSQTGTEGLKTSLATEKHPWDTDNEAHVSRAEFLDGSKSIVVDPKEAVEGVAKAAFDQIDKVDTVENESEEHIDTPKEYLTLNNWIFTAINKLAKDVLTAAFVDTAK